ncbi:hypothetical protein FKG94_03035 [Exilibacterium tricleocarpae]|uniref:Uncharacterized protein n=1 Tax=Exilibacterium tricleocarpae TaxID=2591008 RepID=A0A545U6T3_9GAMM|nr:hypothetical protein [Exilibacterium tricleocarpae]TQV85178.1 hypothetical protein FKG94_03035 [Exilibacterium tricleocarpae]
MKLEKQVGLIEAFSAQLKNAEGLNKKFLAELQNPRAKDDRVPAGIFVDGARVVVEYGGHDLVATSKVVKDSDRGLSVEYRFFVDLSGEAVEISRFYLVEGRDITKSLQERKSIVKSDNSYLADHIWLAVVKDFIESSVFDESPR